MGIDNFESKNEATARKLRSIKILQEHHIPYLENLPLIETKNEVRVRTKDEIAKRAIACLLTIQLACDRMNGDVDIEESKSFLMELLSKFDVKDCLTPKEVALFSGEPTEQEIVDMTWKYEAYWVLLWALGIVDKLDFPCAICDCRFAIKAVSSCDSYASFLEKVSLRSIDEILDEADLIFRYDWACVEARIHGADAPQGLDGGVVLERHKALNWLIDSDQDNDWDHVSANT